MGKICGIYHLLDQSKERPLKSEDLQLNVTWVMQYFSAWIIKEIILLFKNLHKIQELKHIEKPKSCTSKLFIISKSPWLFFLPFHKIDYVLIRLFWLFVCFSVVSFLKGEGVWSYFIWLYIICKLLYQFFLLTDGSKRKSN